MANDNNKTTTDFNLHVGGDGVKTDVSVPRETTTFGLSILAFGLVAYLVKTYARKAMNK